MATVFNTANASWDRGRKWVLEFWSLWPRRVEGQSAFGAFSGAEFCCKFPLLTGWAGAGAFL
jgi:hypothetical protein